ncbi:MAG: phytanoyl-CoA dioxygenase family protein [Pseudomonadota bacterium]
MNVCSRPIDRPNSLTETQISCFCQTGFLHVPGFFPDAEQAEIESWCQEVTEMPEVPGKQMVYYEQSELDRAQRILQRIEDFSPHHQGLNQLFCHSRLSGAVADLLGEKALLFKDKINYKLPGGGAFAPHQDIQAGWQIYAPFFVTAMISIDGSTEKNGCLEMVSGWHKKGLLGDEWAPLTEEQRAQMDFVPLPTEPGDVVFFDSFAPHKSAPNLSNSQRRVLYVTYNGASHGDQRRRYFKDKRAAFPPDIERNPDQTYQFRV